MNVDFSQIENLLVSEIKLTPIQARIFLLVVTDGKMNADSGAYLGLTIIEARKKIIEDLKKLKLLVNQTKRKQIVQVGERSKEPVEIINSVQWYVKYLDQRSNFLKGMK